MTNMDHGSPDWSEAARSVWGKSSGYEGEDWLPLVQHLTDSADVADFVWPWLPRHVRDLIEGDLPDGARNGQVLLRWLAGIHDCGKISHFAAKVPTLAERMRAHGLVLPRDTSDFHLAPHGLVGHVVLERWLKDRFNSPVAAARTYAIIVGGHHGVPPTNSKIQWLKRKPELVGLGTWKTVQDEILDGMAHYTGAHALLPAWAAHRLSPTSQSLLTAAVIICDWLASNTDLFPFGDSDARRAEEAWTELGLAPGWQPTSGSTTAGELLSQRFPGVGTEPRPMQDLAVRLAAAASSPPLLIVESAMGSGKSEAALMAAEVLAAKFNCGGLYIGLPTMATSDGMFGRVLSWIERLDTGATSVHLAHGKAGLNDDYVGLTRVNHLAPVYDDDLHADDVTAHVQSWLTGRKKGVLATMVVGTIDQLLFMALQSKHVVLRHLAFAGKVVVVDEVHAADTFMRHFLCRALEWLAAYGVPVILLSATLPSAQREELANAYRSGLGLPDLTIEPSLAYPLVTMVERADVISHTATADEPAPQVTLSVSVLDSTPAALLATLGDWLTDGGCVAVICNTVARAQETARLLRAVYGDDVELHHSRFVATHRTRKEQGLRSTLGPHGVRPERRIVVGTQVLEQSLDVDFDAMITDIAPMDLILQRVGRLHRHERIRPSRLTTPHLVITGISEWGENGPVFDRGCQAVYGESSLLRAAGTLGLTPTSDTTIALPSAIRPLVEAAYADQPSVPTPWLARTKLADAVAHKSAAEARDSASTFRLPSVPELAGDLRKLLEYSSKEAEESPGAGRVRDTEDGIEVIVVQQIDGVVRHLDDGSPLAGRVIATAVGDLPAYGLARAVSACTVRLPLAMTRSGQVFDAVVTELERAGYEGWQKSPWLAGQLVLHLDESWTARLAGFDLTYSMTDGLTVSREEIAA